MPGGPGPVHQFRLPSQLSSNGFIVHRMGEIPGMGKSSARGKMNTNATRVPVLCERMLAAHEVLRRDWRLERRRLLVARSGRRRRRAGADGRVVRTSAEA